MTLSGSPLSQSPYTDRLKNDDLFLISRKTNEILGDFKSLNIDYSTISGEVFRRLSSEFKYGSMAWESSADYSPIYHEHDCYNKIHIQSLPQYQKSIPIAVINIDGQRYELCAPEPEFESQVKPVPGQLKFLAIPKMTKNINISSDDFDGWVYPDGSIYNSRDFQYSYYFEQVNDEQFRVPNLTDFIYAINDLTSYNNVDCNPVDQIGGMRRHKHYSQVQCSGKGEVSFGITDSKDWNPGEYAHSHFRHLNKDVKYRIPMKFKLDGINVISNQQIRTSTQNEDGILTHPTFDKIPVLIYIGKMVKYDR